MNSLLVDIILVAFLICALIWGWQRGLIKVLAGVGSLILAYQIARNWSAIAAEIITSRATVLQPGHQAEPLSHLLSLFIDTGAMANRLVEIVLFIILFILIRWVVRAIARLLTGVLGGGILGKVNKALGSVSAVILGGILILIVVQIILPALAGLGLGSGLLHYLTASRWVIPSLSAWITFV